MTRPGFNEREMRVVDTIPASIFMPEVEIFDYPCSPQEAMKAAYRREPVWQPVGVESKMIAPVIDPDNVARAFVYDATNATNDRGGLDMFGVEWVFVPSAMGCMVKPGNPILMDANDWPQVLTFPEIDSWDWKGSGELNNGTYLQEGTFNTFTILNGFFERLISFMDFDGAVMALFDEDQQEATKALFLRLADMYCDLVDHVVDTFIGIGAFQLHDDWGSSLDTFFSPDLASEIIVPAMRKLTDHIHERGCFVELHSCGNNFKQIPNYIAAGFDYWCPQAAVNDVDAIYDAYGDQIIIGTHCAYFDPDTATEEEQVAHAREYAEKYCNPAKPTMLDLIESGCRLTPAFRRELYRQSRIAYCGVD